MISPTTPHTNTQMKMRFSIGKTVRLRHDPNPDVLYQIVDITVCVDNDAIQATAKLSVCRDASVGSGRILTGKQRVENVVDIVPA